MKNKTRYTIKDIAELAEVSRATVDRVIHGRGPVSKETYDKIQLILEKIDYQPNLIAQTLKKGESYRIAVLMPDPEHDVYWKRALEGIENAVSDYSFVGVTIDKYLFNPYKEVSFVLNARQVVNERYQGVILAPFFYNESLEFLQQCSSAQLPVLTFNTCIKDSDVLCHVGQDLIQSGSTAASLLDRTTSEGDELLVLHVDEDLENARHMQEKEDGFKKFYDKRREGSRKIHTVKLGKPHEIEKTLMRAFEGSERIRGIFVSTSKVHYVAEIINAYKLDIRLAGYDLIDENIVHLEAGNIDFLIYQNPKHQANLALNYMVDHLVFSKEIPAQKLLPTEIVIRENFSNYLQ